MKSLRVVAFALLALSLCSVPAFSQDQEASEVKEREASFDPECLARCLARGSDVAACADLCEIPAVIDPGKSSELSVTRASSDLIIPVQEEEQEQVER